MGRRPALVSMSRATCQRRYWRSILRGVGTNVGNGFRCRRVPGRRSFPDASSDAPAPTHLVTANRGVPEHARLNQQEAHRRDDDSRLHRFSVWHHFPSSAGTGIRIGERRRPRHRVHDRLDGGELRALARNARRPTSCRSGHPVRRQRSLLRVHDKGRLPGRLEVADF